MFSDLAVAFCLPFLSSSGNSGLEDVQSAHLRSNRGSLNGCKHRCVPFINKRQGSKKYASYIGKYIPIRMPLAIGAQV